MFSMVVAVNNKGVIGLNDTMPWHVPEDLKHFKKTTLHHNLVMGRVTYENLPGKLGDRTIWVVSRNLKGDRIINDFDQFLKEHKDTPEVYYIGGGAEINKAAMDYTDEIILSRIDNDVDGDTFFPLDALKDFDLVRTIKKEGFTIEYYNRKGR